MHFHGFPTPLYYGGHQRLKFFQRWIEESVPDVFWFSGFFFPLSFLSGIKQNFARRHKIPIDKIYFEFQVMDTEVEDLLEERVRTNFVELPEVIEQLPSPQLQGRICHLDTDLEDLEDEEVKEVSLESSCSNVEENGVQGRSPSSQTLRKKKKEKEKKKKKKDGRDEDNDCGGDGGVGEDGRADDEEVELEKKGEKDEVVGGDDTEKDQDEEEEEEEEEDLGDVIYRLLPKQKDGGAYVWGLFLEGATWDRQLHHLTEMAPKRLYDQLPIVLIEPAVLPHALQDSSCNHDQAAETPPGGGSDATGYYSCPVYRSSERRGTITTTGHSSNYIFDLVLPSVRSEDHWVKRGTAALTQLDD